ncbi:T9SS type A sorting domain-containing protein [Labilibacter marinus]
MLFISNLSAGVYVVQLPTSNGVYSQKVIIS